LLCRLRSLLLLLRFDDWIMIVLLLFDSGDEGGVMVCTVVCPGLCEADISLNALSSEGLCS
jgi:hypothetical protein